jgi:protein pelota
MHQFIPLSVIYKYYALLFDGKKRAEMGSMKSPNAATSHMKILEKNERQGIVKIVVDSADDLWYLHTIVDRLDRCTGDSEYKYKLDNAKGGDGKAQVIKKKVWVSITVEKSEFSTGAGQLRISGLVYDGSEDVPRGSHHTLDISEGSRLTIQKERWLDYQQEKLEEAQSAKTSTLLVLFDRESAIFALLTPSGHEVVLNLKGDVPKKGVDEGRAHAFYKEIVGKIAEYVSRGAEHVIAASPSFWKEYLEKELSPELRKRTLFTTISEANENSIKEILRRPELQTALKAQRSTREQILIDDIMTALARDRLIYGKEDILQALNEGNISELTVTEHAIATAKDNDCFDELESLLRLASDIKAKVHLLSTKEAMGKVDGLGGIVGVKRW